MSLTTIPLELLLQIFSDVDYFTLLYAVPLVCKRLHHILSFPSPLFDSLLFRGEVPVTKKGRKYKLHPILTSLSSHASVDLVETFDLERGHLTCTWRETGPETSLMVTRQDGENHPWSYSFEKSIREYRHTDPQAVLLENSWFCNDHIVSPGVESMNVKLQNFITESFWGGNVDWTEFTVGSEGGGAVTVRTFVDGVVCWLKHHRLSGYLVLGAEVSVSGGKEGVPTVALNLRREWIKDGDYELSSESSTTEMRNIIRGYHVGVSFVEPDDDLDKVVGSMPPSFAGPGWESKFY